MQKRTLITVCGVAVLSLMLSGCPAMVVAGAATSSAVAINDSRTLGALAEDEAIENKMLLRLAENFGHSVHIGVTSYNRRVLLTGQASTEEVKQRIIAMAQVISNVRSIVDYIKIGNPSSLVVRASDTYQSLRAKAALCGVQQKDFSCLHIKVVTEKGVLYLMGLVDKEEAAIAIERVRRVPGVINVVKVFEYH